MIETGTVTKPELYDTIGSGYRDLRQPDPRIEAAVCSALGNASSVVNVGAGAGSYEPDDRPIVAVEPSMTMIRQRRGGLAPVIRATGTSLPFRDGAFGASLAILTLHHWPDPDRGLCELARVARDAVVVLTWDPAAPGFWLTDYLPEILAIDRPIFPRIDAFRHRLGTVDVHELPIPHDCSDGFLGAYWRRPAAYLDPRVRSGISTFSKIPHIDDGLRRLRQDLDSGAWRRRYGSLLAEAQLDLGYRLVVARLR